MLHPRLEQMMAMKSEREKILAKYTKIMARTLEDGELGAASKAAEAKLERMRKEHPWLHKQYIIDQAVQKQMAELRERTGMPRAESVAAPQPPLRDSVFDFIRGKFVDVTGMDPVQWGMAQIESAIEYQIRAAAEQGEALIDDIANFDIEEFLMSTFATLHEELHDRVIVLDILDAEDDDGVPYVVIDGLEFPESLVRRILDNPDASAEDVGKFIIDILAGGDEDDDSDEDDTED